MPRSAKLGHGDRSSARKKPGDEVVNPHAGVSSINLLAGRTPVHGVYRHLNDKFQIPSAIPNDSNANATH